MTAITGCFMIYTLFQHSFWAESHCDGQLFLYSQKLLVTVPQVGSEYGSNVHPLAKSMYLDYGLRIDVIKVFIGQAEQLKSIVVHVLDH